MKTIIADMDDISLDNSDANGLHWVYYLRGKFPWFKITLFTIPGRSTDAWLRELGMISWVELAVHGNMHEKEERLTPDMLTSWSPEFQKIYKGPDHYTHPSDEVLLYRNGYTIIDKNWLNREGVIHGHCWIKADWERLLSQIEPDTDFKFISEVL